MSTGKNTERHKVWMAWAALAFLLSIVVLLGALLRRSPPGFSPRLDGNATYYAVGLVGGQLYYGRPEIVSGGVVELSDVYYVAREANPEIKKVRNTLIWRRKSEWHGPTKMHLNARHVLLMEPVAPTSQVARLIAEQRAKRD